MCLDHEECLCATIMAVFGFNVQIHQSHAPKTNIPSLRPREDFFYSLNAYHKSARPVHAHALTLCGLLPKE